MEDTVAVLERWTDSGARWSVVARTPTTVEIALLTCDGGEEADRIRSADPALLHWVGDRWTSDD